MMGFFSSMKEKIFSSSQIQSEQNSALLACLANLH